VLEEEEYQKCFAVWKKWFWSVIYYLTEACA